MHGDKDSSFVYGAQDFSAQAIAYDQHSREFFVFGNRWPSAPGGSILFIHRYKAAGEFLGSTFPLPSEASALGLEVYDQPIVQPMDGGDTPVWFMLPWEYQVFGILPDGNTRVVFRAPKDFNGFRAPTTRLKVSNLAALQQWLLTWTPVTAFSSDGNTLLVETQCFCPAEYKADMWSLRTGAPVTSFSTNWRVIGSVDHKYYFVHEGLSTQDDSISYTVARSKGSWQ